jgi:hypothetical protein
MGSRLHKLLALGLQNHVGHHQVLAEEAGKFEHQICELLASQGCLIARLLSFGHWSLLV